MSGLCRISRPADSKRISGYNILHPFIRFLSAGRLATINQNPRVDIGHNPSDSREDMSGLCRISRPADSKRISGYNILHPFIRFLSAGRLATVDQIHRVDIGHNPSDSREDTSGLCRISRPADSKRISGYNILPPFIRFLSAGRLATVDQIPRADIGHNPSDSREDMSGLSSFTSVY